MIAAATGHRPNRLGGYGPHVSERLYRLAMDWIAEHRPSTCISGMALGWDTAWARAALDSGVPLIAALPFAGQEWPWPHDAQETYRALLQRATLVEVISPGGYSVAALYRRDRWMVDHSTQLVALWNGEKRTGTGLTVRYATGRVPVDNLWERWV